MVLVYQLLIFQQDFCYPRFPFLFNLEISHFSEHIVICLLDSEQFLEVYSIFLYRVIVYEFFICVLNLLYSFIFLLDCQCCPIEGILQLRISLIFRYCYRGSLGFGCLATRNSMGGFLVLVCLGLGQTQVPFLINILNDIINLVYGDLSLVGVYVIPPSDYPDQ